MNTTEILALVHQKMPSYPPSQGLPSVQKSDFIQDALLTSDPITFLPESPDDSVSFKVLGKIPPRSKHRAKSTCYIPERNLFLALLTDSRTILVYNASKDFKLIAKRIVEMDLEMIDYFKGLDKIIGGGCFINMWDPIDFKLQAQSPKILYDEKAQDLVYLPNPNVIVAKTARGLYVYRQDLTVLARFEISQRMKWSWSTVAKILFVSQDLLLAVCSTSESRPLLLNLKSKAVKEYDQIEIHWTSCVGVREETPNKVFTCLISVEKPSFSLTLMEKLAVSLTRVKPYKLIQFIIDPKTEELKISRATKTDRSFNKLSQLDNSKYFLAEGSNPSNISEIFLLSIEKDQVEIIRVISGLEYPYNDFVMIKTESLMVRREDRALWLYKCSIKRREKESQSQEGDRDKNKAEETIDPLQSYLP